MAQLPQIRQLLIMGRSKYNIAISDLERDLPCDGEPVR